MSLSGTWQDAMPPEEWLQLVAPDVPILHMAAHVAETGSAELGLPEAIPLWIRGDYDRAAQAVAVTMPITTGETGQLVAALALAAQQMPEARVLLMDPEASPLTSDIATYVLRARAARYAWKVAGTYAWYRCHGLADLLQGVSTHLTEGHSIELALNSGQHYALVDRVLYVPSTS